MTFKTWSIRPRVQHTRGFLFKIKLPDRVIGDLCCRILLITESWHFHPDFHVADSEVAVRFDGNPAEAVADFAGPTDLHPVVADFLIAEGEVRCHFVAPRTDDVRIHQVSGHAFQVQKRIAVLTQAKQRQKQNLRHDTVSFTWGVEF